MGITIKDVAEKAAVAPSTVSRVIHNNSRISEETRRRVRQAMDELGYHPNAAARSLARGKTRTLGLIIPDSEEDLFVKPFFTQALRGLSIEAKKQGYNIMFTFSVSQEEELSSLEQFVRQNIVDGIVLMTARDDDRSMAFLEEKDCPYVVIGRPAQNYRKALWVDNDNLDAMFRMCRYFLQQGKKKIAFLGGPLTYRVTRNRLEGYKKALKEGGISPEDELIYLGSDFMESDGFKGMEKILSRGMPDAVVAADDSLAIGGTGVYENPESYNSSFRFQQYNERRDYLSLTDFCRYSVGRTGNQGRLPPNPETGKQGRDSP